VVQKTKASIEIDVKGLKAVNELLNKLNSINTKVNNINKFAGPKGRKDQLSDQQKIETQINRLQTRSVKLRTQLVGLNEKDKKIQTIKARLTRAENKAAVGKFTAANNELAIAEKELATQKLTTAELAKQAKFAPSSALNFSKSGKLLQGPAGSSQNTGVNLMRRFGPAKGFDFQSALISGGFPLLFGQGPVTAAAGALGGGIGGMFGQMGGFAGGIAATAAVQSLSNFTRAIGELGNALSRPTENIGSLVEKLGLANDPAGRLALRLEKLGLTSSASALLMEEFTKQTGKSPEVLKDAAEEINEMNKSLATFGLKLQLLGAKVITPIVDLLNKIPFGSIGEKLKPLGNFLLFGPGGDPTKTVNRMKGISNIPASEGNAIIGGVPLNPDFGKTAPQIDKTSALEALAGQAEFNRNILPLQQSLDIEKQRFNLSSKDLAVRKEANKLQLKSKELTLLKNQAELDNNDALNLKIQKLTAEVALQQQIFENAQTLADPIKAQTIQLDQQMRVLLDRGSQVVALSQAISSSFEQSFTGIINGTMSIQDAFRNMLNSIANHFINTAAKMMANQLQTGLLGVLGQGIAGAFSGGFGSSFVGGAGLFSGGGLAGANSIPFGSVNLGLSNFADGGRPPVGRASIVGERGPELFVPNRSGTIIPNNKLGGGNNTSVVVNVDASGSDVQGDEEQATQFGSAIATAIQSELIKQQRPGGLLSR